MTEFFAMKRKAVSTFVFSSAICFMAVGASAGAQYTIIVTNGMPVPEGNGTFDLRLSQSPVINDAGQVSFESELDGMVGGSNATGIYRGDGTAGGLVNIVREGQPAPEGNGYFGNFDNVTYGGVPVPINDAGQAVFLATLTGTLGGSNNTGIYRGNGTPGGLTNIARQGQFAPDGNGIYSGFDYSLALNSSGQVAFYGNISGAVNSAQSAGVFRGNGVTCVQIARQLYTYVSGSMGTPSDPAINNGGQVAFRTYPAASIYGVNGIFLGDASTLTEIAHDQMPLGAGETLTSGAGLTVPTINSAGQAAFAGTIVNVGPAIFRGDGSTMAIIAYKGQSPDGILSFSDIQSALALDNAGQVVFPVTLTGPGVGGNNYSALYRGDGTTGSLKVVARQGDAAPDGNGTFAGAFGPTFAMNNSGQVVFQQPTSTDPYGIYFFDDRLGVLKVIATGDPLLGSTVAHTGFHTYPILGGSGNPLNDRGQVTFWFSLNNGAVGIAVWNMPELRITDAKILTNDLRLTWNTIGGRTNFVQAASGAGGVFGDISGGIVVPGSGQVSTNFIEIGGATNKPARFYRIRLQ